MKVLVLSAFVLALPGAKQPTFSLAEATKGLPADGQIIATLDTSKGSIECVLFPEKAPITVANFVGLARGVRKWQDPMSGNWVTKPAYDGTLFHRVIKGFMIQGGDAKGDGTGEPGYTIPDEIWPGAKHDKPGQLCMANRGKNTNGAQFFITDAAAPHLDGGYTIFGQCQNINVIHDIASAPTVPNDKPATPIKINTIAITKKVPLVITAP